MTNADRLRPFLLAVLAAGLVFTGCGGADSASPVPPPEGVPASPEADEAWLRVLSELGLEAEERAVEIGGVRTGDELLLTIAVPADATVEHVFGDGLYGAQAFALIDGAWKRVDVAEIRTLNAPVLQPGESASVRLPVREVGSYRVLVPVGGSAAWADVR